MLITENFGPDGSPLVTVGGASDSGDPVQPPSKTAKTATSAAAKLDLYPGLI